MCYFEIESVFYCQLGPELGSTNPSGSTPASILSLCIRFQLLGVGAGTSNTCMQPSPTPTHPHQ